MSATESSDRIEAALFHYHTTLKHLHIAASQGSDLLLPLRICDEAKAAYDRACVEGSAALAKELA